MVANEMTAIYSEENPDKITGVSVYYDSKISCSTTTLEDGTVDQKDYTFTFDVLCDPSITGMAA